MEPQNKCSYPNKCKKEGLYMQAFKLINEEGASVELLFCKYHHLIVMGGHFKAKIIVEENKADSFELIGPLKEVEIAEQVIAAREVMLQTKK